MEIKEIWKVFKMSSMQDKDMQTMFRRHATPNVCIELLEENEKLDQYVRHLEMVLKQFTIYEWREIGEAEWALCNEGWFAFCQSSPIHDTRKKYLSYNDIMAAGIRLYASKMQKTKRPVTPESVIKSMINFAEKLELVKE